MSVVVRFAPSPTGLLHVGNARAALINWLLAKQADGRFILRIDDTDTERSKPAYVAAIKEDLSWLGFEWDALFHQSANTAHYEAAAQKLKADGRLYACYETAEELDKKRKSARARNRAPIYDRAALKLSEEERRELEAEGRKPHWRFLLNLEDITWEDGIRGAQKFHGRHLSDPVLIRADGTYLYTLPSVVDDLEHGITDIVRGEDHVANTAVQIQLLEALGGTAGDIRFAHVPLLVGRDGQNLSKRLGSLSLASLRDEGLEPMALNSLLAGLGTMDAIAAHETLAALASDFSLSRFSRNPPRFDEDELWRLNADILRAAEFESIQARLDLPEADAPFWLAVRENIRSLAEARDWWAVCQAPIEPVIEDGAFLSEAAELLPPEPWDSGTWKSWTTAVREKTGRKGKGLFHPIRLALTARGDGPALANLLPVIGRARAHARLMGNAA